MKTGFLVSGDLGLSVLKKCTKYIKPDLVCTDGSSKDIIDFAHYNDIEIFKGNPRSGRLANFISEQQFEVLFSVNYLFLLEQDVIDKSKYLINFHGSLLPKYRGRSPHVWAIINNEKITGITGHLIDSRCDSGPIVIQEMIELDDNMTGNDVLNRFKMVYPLLVLKVWDQIKSDTLSYSIQNESLATYFGKRTPEDGMIDWSWQKERIYNWVRAQAYPYPGAFTTINNNKLIIDEVKSWDYGFSYLDKNGLVLGAHQGKPIIKTPNGPILLQKIRTEDIANLIVPGVVLGV